MTAGESSLAILRLREDLDPASMTSLPDKHELRTLDVNTAPPSAMPDLRKKTLRDFFISSPRYLILRRRRYQIQSPTSALQMIRGCDTGKGRNGLQYLGAHCSRHRSVHQHSVKFVYDGGPGPIACGKRLQS